MKILFKTFLGLEKNKRDDFSLFLTKSSSREKKKLFKKVIREANADQRILVNKRTTKTA